ncbi:unnamed protein product [Rhizophagus irregularis]|nr:unnamed protein product [Rhizophagus irregularis]
MQRIFFKNFLILFGVSNTYLLLGPFSLRLSLGLSSLCLGLLFIRSPLRPFFFTSLFRYVGSVGWEWECGLGVWKCGLGVWVWCGSVEWVGSGYVGSAGWVCGSVGWECGCGVGVLEWVGSGYVGSVGWEWECGLGVWKCGLGVWVWCGSVGVGMWVVWVGSAGLSSLCLGLLGLFLLGPSLHLPFIQILYCPVPYNPILPIHKIA